MPARPLVAGCHGGGALPARTARNGADMGPSPGGPSRDL
jgi:hypothetical protein